MKSFIKKYNMQIKLIIPLVIGLVVITTFLYYFIPIILNYPDGTWGTNFQIELENANYLSKFIQI